jgi:hypothetical protein
MVENGRGMERPGMLDPLPQNGDNIMKETILRMRALDFWNWAAEHNWVYEYAKGKIKYAKDVEDMRKAREYHGLR